MKVMTILGTRPEMIRLSLIIQKLDQFASKHILVHTGQNHTASLTDIFFEQLGIRKPDVHLQLPHHSIGAQLGTMFAQLEAVLQKERPDRVLVLGDTNSALSTILVERLGVPVYHMEAGNRCYDLRVPEEKNRKIIDVVSTWNLPYTKKSRENLLAEGFPKRRIFLCGNPIYEVLHHHEKSIDKSDVLTRLNLSRQAYFVATLHRAENVDDQKRLRSILEGFKQLGKKYGMPVICSLHPRTRSKLQGDEWNDAWSSHIQFHEPFGLFDFVHLQKHAFCVLTDSGTVQEESCLFRVPAVTVRESSERPETVECGSNVVCGTETDAIVQAVQVMVQQPRTWTIPEGYEDPHVSDKVVKFILGGRERV